MEVCLLQFNQILTADVISWRSVMRLCVSWLPHIELSVHTPFLSKATFYFFLKCIRNERRKSAGRRICLNWVSNLQHSGQCQTRYLLNYPAGPKKVEAFLTFNACQSSPKGKKTLGKRRNCSLWVTSPWAVVQ